MKSIAEALILLGVVISLATCTAMRDAGETQLKIAKLKCETAQ